MAIARSHRDRLTVVSLTLSLLFLLGTRASVASQGSGTELHVTPNAIQVAGGQTVTLTLAVENVASLCRAELHLNYDVGLEIQDADPTRAGVQIEPGEIFGGCTQWNEARDGVIHFVAQRDPDVGPFSGSGDIAHVVVTVATSVPGGYLVSFDRAATRLLDCEGHPIDVRQSDDGVLVIPPTLSGSVTRDGWSTCAGTTVAATLYRAGSSLPVAQGDTGSDSAGDFTLTTWTIPPTVPSPSVSPPPGCSAGWVHVRLDYPNYLAECYRLCAAGGVVNVGQRQLEGGDVNGDGCVNIADIVLIIGEYGSAVTPPCYTPVTGSPDTAPQGDINGDCQVNILDLTQAAGNFGLCSNCP